MNADHVDAMILLARSNAQLEATEATMASVDRLGFSLRLPTNEWIKGVRINFLYEVATPSRWCSKPRHEADTCGYPPHLTTLGTERSVRRA
jgi:hypothetical protein